MYGLLSYLMLEHHPSSLMNFSSGGGEIGILGSYHYNHVFPRRCNPPGYFMRGGQGGRRAGIFRRQTKTVELLNILIADCKTTEFQH